MTAEFSFGTMHLFVFVKCMTDYVHFSAVPNFKLKYYIEGKEYMKLQ